jgi:hypothetical protein
VNHQEWATYQAGEAVVPVIRGDEFPMPRTGWPMRLLCRGYNANGGPNVRIWLNFEGQIGVQYNDGNIVFQPEWETQYLYPTKRAYREDTDLLFAQLMRDRHEYPLSFTTWQR